MDYIKKFANSENSETPSNGVATEAGGTSTRTDQSGNGGGFMGSINNALGGGKTGETKEDGLDKAVDWVQEHVMGQGSQNNESAAEQVKDEAISDTIRAQYKNMTGKDFPISDK